MKNIILSVNVNYLNELATTGVLSDWTNKLVAIMLVVAGLLIGIFFIVNLGWNLLHNGFKFLIGEQNKAVNFMEIGRAISLLVLLIIYYPGQWLVVQAVGQINSFMTLGLEKSQTLSRVNIAYGTGLYDNLKEDQLSGHMPDVYVAIVLDPKSSAQEKADAEEYLRINGYAEYLEIKRSKTDEENAEEIKNALKGSWVLDFSADTKKAELAAKKMAEEEVLKVQKKRLTNGGLLDTLDKMFTIEGLIFGIIEWFCLLTRGIVGFIAVMTAKILIIIGPLVIAFSMIPMFKDKLPEWFGTLLTTALAIGVIGLIDYLNMEYKVVVLSDPSWKDKGVLLSLDIAISILYTRIFWLAAKIVGSKDGAALGSKVGQMSIGVVTMAAGAALGFVAAKTASSGGANKLVDGLINAGKEAVKGSKSMGTKE